MKAELVQDWMTPNPICVTPQTPLPEALQLMKERRIRRLPIVEKGKLVGIVTRGDLRGAQPSEATSLSIYEINYLIGRLTLDHLMTKRVVTVTPGTTISEAALLMLRHGIAGLPVMGDGHVVGILTESDIFRPSNKMNAQETVGKSRNSQWTRMPDECWRDVQSECVGDETDATRTRFFPPPNDSGPSHCHAQYIGGQSRAG